MVHLHYAGAEYSYRWRRYLAAILSMALGLALFLSLQAYASAYRQAARAPLTQIGADIAVQRQGDIPLAFEGPVFPHSTAPIHPDEISAIKRIPGVVKVGQAVLFWDFGPDQFSVVLGLEPASSVDEATGPARLQSAVVEGRFLLLNERGAAAADISFAQEHNIGLGDSLGIANKTFTIVGLVDTSYAGQVANANLYIPLADARDIASTASNVLSVHDFRPNDANILFVKANQARAEQVTAAIASLLGEQALISSSRSFIEVLGAGFALIDRFSWLVGVLGMLIAVAGYLRSVAVSLGERGRDIALMRALGWQRRNIVSQIIAEVLILFILGALVGLGLSFIATLILGQGEVNIPVPWELSPTPHFLPGGAEEMGLTIPLPARIHGSAILTSLVLAFISCLGVGIIMASRAANKKPVEALKNE